MLLLKLLVHGSMDETTINYEYRTAGNFCGDFNIGEFIY